jgi:phosphorylase kinase alpha/beta subunit
MLIIHNEKLLNLTRSNYSFSDIENLFELLLEKETLKFPRLENGLFPAAVLDEKTEYTGYSNVWVRDNVHVAHAHYVWGKTEMAVQNAQTLMQYFTQHRSRFEDIINDPSLAEEVMNRPHIRFNGKTLKENPEDWPHAQNDALGYFLWFYCLLAREGLIKVTESDVETLARFPLYFRAIAFWQDEDSGHWEETRKVSASSIGTVVAGLKALKQLNLNTDFVAHCCQYNGEVITPRLLEELIQQGNAALNQILPAECIQDDPLKKRDYDGALLFLIYPLNVVSETMAVELRDRALDNLEGNYGIKRYLGDSFWFPNYKKLLSQEDRTADFSNEIEKRDAFLEPGQEAQWCIFDPIVSAIFGQNYQQTKRHFYLEKQIHYLNRSLGQITGKDSEFGAYKCPELYHVEGNQYVPSDAIPLLWTQANLVIALKMMESNLSSQEGTDTR